MQQFTQQPGQRAPANGAGTQRRHAARGVFASIELSRPIDSHEGAKSTIDVAEPTFGDWIDCGGQPYRRIGEHNPETGHVRMEVIDRPEVLLAWIRRLTGLHEAEIRQLSPRDSHALRVVVSDAVNEFDSGGNSPPAPTSSSS